MSRLDHPIKIILADDHPIVRAGIRAELEKIPNLQVAAEADDGRAAVELVAVHQPEVVFMDISMHGLNGLEATTRITRDHPKVRVIILSMHQSEEYFWQALRAGAAGYLLKKAATAEISTALEQVLNGEVFLSKEISNRLVQRLPTQIARQKRPIDQLTERQREILQLIAEGQTTKAIALILNISAKTVEYHRMRLMEQLNIFDVPGLVRFALQSGLISQE